MGLRGKKMEKMETLEKKGGGDRANHGEEVDESHEMEHEYPSLPPVPRMISSSLVVNVKVELSTYDATTIELHPHANNCIRVNFIIPLQFKYMKYGLNTIQGHSITAQIQSKYQDSTVSSRVQSLPHRHAECHYITKEAVSCGVTCVTLFGVYLLCT
jgi:hypothetical protein